LDVDGLPIEGSVSITDVASFTKEEHELWKRGFDKMNFDDLGLTKLKT
jgi:hypothetical protein